MLRCISDRMHKLVLARIPQLSPFDKIVGGLCWCIDTSGEGVDVDILFTENSTIGQRM